MTSGRWRLIAAASGGFLLSALGGALHAQATISGRVISTTSNAPLADARVVIIGSTASAVTSEDGRYIIRNAPTGTAQLQALRVGYQSQKKTVTVPATGTATADFTLEVAVV